MITPSDVSAQTYFSFHKSSHCKIMFRRMFWPASLALTDVKWYTDQLVIQIGKEYFIHGNTGNSWL